MSSPIRALGFTLVELLVGLFLSGLLILGIFQIFDGSRQGARVQRALATVQDGGRIAIEFLSRDIRSADFSGCLADKGEIVNHLDLDPMSEGYANNRLRFYDLGAVSATSVLSTYSFGDKDVVANTDILRLVGARPYCEGSIYLDGDQDTPTSNLSLAQIPGRECDIPNGEVLLVASCFSGDIFLKTGGDGGVIVHASDTEIAGLKNLSNAFSNTYLSGTAFIYKPYVYDYFVAEGANGSNALFRREDSTNYELVSNVDDFQVVFGVDSDGDGLAESIVDQTGPNSISENDTILFVRVSITLRSPEPVNGAPLTRTYTATTNIRNRLVAGT